MAKKMKGTKRFAKAKTGIATAVALAVVAAPAGASAAVWQGEPALYEVQATNAEGLFGDLDQAAAWSEEAIRAAKEQGLLGGDEEGNFRPLDPITRQETAVLLTRLLQLDTPAATESPFSDVPADSWSASAIEAVKAAGILRGFPDGTFKPASNITREELAVMLAGAMEWLGYEDSGNAGGIGGIGGFSDGESISPWAQDAVALAVSLGLLQGNGQQFAPKSLTTRQEVAVISVRFADAKQQLQQPSTVPDETGESGGNVSGSVSGGSGSSSGSNGGSGSNSGDDDNDDGDEGSGGGDEGSGGGDEGSGGGDEGSGGGDEGSGGGDEGIGGGDEGSSGGDEGSGGGDEGSDTTAPVVTVSASSVEIGQDLVASISEAGTLYLVPEYVEAGEGKEWLEQAVEEGLAAKHSVTVPGEAAIIGTADLPSGSYVVYAVDAAGNVSAASSTVQLNSRPEYDGSFAELKFMTWETPEAIDMSAYFGDPDGDELEYAVTSGDVSVIDAGNEGSLLYLFLTGMGQTSLTVTATDPYGLSVTGNIDVTVKDSVQIGDGLTVPAGGQGTVYLVPESSETVEAASLEEAVRNGYGTKTDISETDSEATVATSGLAAGRYAVYTVDEDGNLDGTAKPVQLEGTPATIAEQFADDHLQAAMAYWLYDDPTHVDEPLTRTMLAEALVESGNTLEARGAGISSLEGYEIFFGLDVRYVYLSNNSLQSVDASGLSYLEELDLSDNEISELNVNGLTNLSDLNVRSNKLTSLEVSGLAQLNFLTVSSNELERLDLSGLDHLYEFLAYDNQLEEVDLSGVRNLQYLDLSNNRIRSLDVSELEQLNVLYADLNELWSMPEGVSKLPLLHTLSINNNNIDLVAEADIHETLIDRLGEWGYRYDLVIAGPAEPSVISSVYAVDFNDYFSDYFYEESYSLQAEAEDGTKVELSVEDGQLIVEPLKPTDGPIAIKVVAVRNGFEEVVSAYVHVTVIELPLV